MASSAALPPMVLRILQALAHPRPLPTARFHRAAYPAFVGLCVLFTATRFYGEMLEATGGEWSAPLDDVFIHFDYARSTARGYWFQWSEGNGYSSGNTSLTYPFALALGYWVGFRGMALMQWAAILACVCALIFLLISARLADRLPRATRYVLPVAVLSMGALSWSIFSGMEVAFFLAVWALGLGVALDHEHARRSEIPRLGWTLGLLGLLIVATRPEGATAVAVLGIAAAWLAGRGETTWRDRLAMILRAGSPGVFFLVLQAAVNKALTGHTAAAGALVKLAYFHPYMTSSEKWDQYLFHLRYTVLRNIHHHFADKPLFDWIPTDKPIFGWIPVVLAGVALISRRTRRGAAILLSSTVLFLLVVATNGQVRWQNERYTMPAVAWLFVAAALGVGVLLDPRTRSVLLRWTWPLRVTLAVLLASLYGIHQAPRMKDQIWFFGRASRNIRDQHTTAGRVIRDRIRPTTNRVLVGDAGAIIYASDLPGLDIIGLGGYHGLPIAESSVHGVGATVELIERIPPKDRPAVMALYPTWWGKFPLWFGRRITSVWVEGNVICGGEEKAIYAADWHLLGTGAYPSRLEPGSRMVDELDVADILSEKAHNYRFPHPGAGFVEMRILAYPSTSYRDVFDAGRKIPEGRPETFELRSLDAVSNPSLLIRAAPIRTGTVDVAVESSPIGSIELKPAGGWVDGSLKIPFPLEAGRRYQFSLTARGLHSWVNYHVWLVSNR